MMRWSNLDGAIPPARCRPMRANELIALAREKLADFAEDPEFLAFRWPRLLQGLDAFLAFEAQRRPLVETLAVEVGGRLTIPLEDGSDFALTAKADRIEVLEGRVCRDRRLQERAPAVRQGGARRVVAATHSGGGDAGARRLPGPCARDAATDAFYVPVGGGDARARGLDAKDKPFRELVAEHFDELVRMLNDFRNPKQGYPARPFPQFAAALQ